MMRSLGVVLMLLLTGAAGRTFGAEPFPIDGWWFVPTFHKVADNVSAVVHFQRYQPPAPLAVIEGFEDNLAELSKHPDEAWLLTIYRSEISVNAADRVQLVRSSIPARITRDHITLFTPLGIETYRVVSTAEGLEIELLGDKSEGSPALGGAVGERHTMRVATSDALDQMQKGALKFFAR